MSLNREVNQINWELAFNDVRHIVCKYLNQKDLCSLSKVNKSWRRATFHEESKRFRIQQCRLLRLPFKFDDSLNLPEPETSDFVNSFYAKSYVSLLIFDRKLEPLGRENTVEEKLLEAFKKVLPGNVIVLKVDEYLTTEDKKDRPGREPTSKFGVQGIFFPSTKQRVRVNVAWHRFQNEKITTFVEINQATARLAFDLKKDHCPNSKSVLLVFSASIRGPLLLAYKLCERMQAPQEMIWVAEVGGSSTGRSLAACSNYPTSGQSNDQWVAALRISGPSVEAWTHEINLFDFSRKEVERELHKLKEQVRLKRHCLAFFAAPVNGGSVRGSTTIMNLVKKVFPGIPFVGLFRDSMKFTIQLLVFSKQFYSLTLVIVTYD